MKSWLIFAVALTASISHAGGLSWNYLDAGAFQAKNSNGGFAEGSLSFSKRWMFQGSYGISKPDNVVGETQCPRPVRPRVRSFACALAIRGTVVRHAPS